MKYAAFCELVIGRWTLAELRGDVPMPEDVLELTDVVGLNRYEAFVLRMEREGKVS